ncbi:MAG: ATP-binding protein [Clostridia bacterium]|nr:ATP-binding protein [Clostridia bacterium]
MKLLKTVVRGLPLFKDDVVITFTATQRVSEDDRDRLYPLFSNCYLNPTEAIIGINASGKTSVLKVILLVLGILNNEPINHISCKDILGKSEEVVVTSYFVTGEKNIFRLETCIKYDCLMGRYIIFDETLWMKLCTSVRLKKTLFDFDDSMVIANRSNDEQFLSDDISIIIAQNKKNKEHIVVADMREFTNVNVLPNNYNIPESVVSFLDPSVESIVFEKKDSKDIIRLKFVGQDEIVLNNSKELENYLSSGTIKGIVVFTQVVNVLKTGGYMIVDEIENHFNKEIVVTLIRFFMDNKINRNGSVLVFTTHYPELLDEFDRNDSIYITRNRDGITVENLSYILTRNDIKKSDAYQSGYLDGTTPAYKAYMRLKKSISSYI